MKRQFKDFPSLKPINLLKMTPDQWYTEACVHWTADISQNLPSSQCLSAVCTAAGMERLLLSLVSLLSTPQPVTCLVLLLPSEEFTRAVYVATGIKLTHHLVNTVFKIFDEDHDNKLSHKEFIGVMKERLHRGDGVRRRLLNPSIFCFVFFASEGSLSSTLCLQSWPFFCYRLMCNVLGRTGNRLVDATFSHIEQEQG